MNRKNRNKIASLLCECMLFVCVLCTGCSSSDGQRYAWPLATASPEDTVTQLFALKFAEEVDELSADRGSAGVMCGRRYSVCRAEYGTAGFVHEGSGGL